MCIRDSGGVDHWLQSGQEIWWNAGECRIAVVQPREDERRHQRLKNRSRHWPADSPQLTQYRVAGRYRFWRRETSSRHQCRCIFQGLERQKLVKYVTNDRSQPVAVTAAVDETAAGSRPEKLGLRSVQLYPVRTHPEKVRCSSKVACRMNGIAWRVVYFRKLLFETNNEKFSLRTVRRRYADIQEEICCTVAQRFEGGRYLSQSYEDGMIRINWLCVGNVWNSPFCVTISCIIVLSKFIIHCSLLSLEFVIFTII